MLAHGQSVCGEGTHSVTQNGILTCVLNDPKGSFSGITPSMDFSSPDAIQNSLSQTLLPNLINVDNLGSIPILYDILVYITSLAGILPITVTFIGIGILLAKKRKNKVKVERGGGVQYLCMKCDTKLSEMDYLENGGLCVAHREKKKFKLPQLFKKKPDKQSYKEYLEKEMASLEKDLEVITDPEQAREVEQTIDSMVSEKESLFDSPEEAWLASLDTAPTEVKDPDKMTIEELEAHIKEKGHKVEVTDGKLEITQNPTIIETKPATIKEVIESNVAERESELSEVLENADFDPSVDEIREAQQKFEEEINTNAELPEDQAPSEEDILEVQRLMKEKKMTQDEAIQIVISNKIAKQKPKEVLDFIETKLTLQQKHEAQDIEEMGNEQDIFLLDLPKKKQSKFMSSAFGKKIMTSKKQKEKERAKETRMVLNDLGEQRMLEYAKKIDDKMQIWAKEQLIHTYEQKEKTTGEKNLSPAEIVFELKKFSLFASMCEMMADAKTSKKRYWIRTSKYETA